MSDKTDLYFCKSMLLSVPVPGNPNPHDTPRFIFGCPIYVLRLEKAAGLPTSMIKQFDSVRVACKLYKMHKY